MYNNSSSIQEDIIFGRLYTGTGKTVSHLPTQKYKTKHPEHREYFDRFAQTAFFIYVQNNIKFIKIKRIAQHKFEYMSVQAKWYLSEWTIKFSEMWPNTQMRWAKQTNKMWNVTEKWNGLRISHTLRITLLNNHKNDIYRNYLRVLNMCECVGPNGVCWWFSFFFFFFCCLFLLFEPFAQNGTKTLR